MRGIKKNNRYGILLIAAMTIPFWLVALALWFTVYSSDDKNSTVKIEADKNSTEMNSLKK
jgi:hypothetical protein